MDCAAYLFLIERISKLRGCDLFKMRDVDVMTADPGIEAVDQGGHASVHQFVHVHGWLRHWSGPCQ